VVSFVIFSVIALNAVTNANMLHAYDLFSPVNDLIVPKMLKQGVYDHVNSHREDTKESRVQNPIILLPFSAE